MLYEHVRLEIRLLLGDVLAVLALEGRAVVDLQQGDEAGLVEGGVKVVHWGTNTFKKFRNWFGTFILFEQRY